MGQSGFYFNWANYNNITSNNISSSVRGLHLYTNSKYNNINNNIITNSSQNGIYIERNSISNNFTNNTISYTNKHALILDAAVNSVYYNRFVGNIFHSNGYGDCSRIGQNYGKCVQE